MKLYPSFLFVQVQGYSIYNENNYFFTLIPALDDLLHHSYFNRWFGDSMKVQYNSLIMLLSSFMQEFGPISSRVYCIFAQITNNKFVVELSIRNLNKCSI